MLSFLMSQVQIDRMKEIEKLLREMQKQGTEYISINDILRMIDNIKYNSRIKRAERLEALKNVA